MPPLVADVAFTRRVHHGEPHSQCRTDVQAAIVPKWAAPLRAARLANSWCALMFSGVRCLESRCRATKGGRHGRRGYPPEFRRRVLEPVASGRRVTDLACDVGVTNQTIYAWRRQEEIDRGMVPGLTSAEREELAAA